MSNWGLEFKAVESNPWTTILVHIYRGPYSARWYPFKPMVRVLMVVADARRKNLKSFHSKCQQPSNSSMGLRREM